MKIKGKKVDKEMIKLFFIKKDPKMIIDLLNEKDLNILEEEEMKFLLKDEEAIKKLDNVETIIKIDEAIIKLDEDTINRFIIDKKTIKFVEEKIEEEAVKLLELIKINVKELKADEKKGLKELRDLLVQLWLHLIGLRKINEKNVDKLYNEFLINQWLADDIRAVSMKKLGSTKTWFQDVKMLEKDLTESLELFNWYLMCKISYKKKDEVLMLLLLVEAIRAEIAKDVKH